jgi:hypothetical protein
MTGGQASLSLDGQAEETASAELVVERIQREGLDLAVPPASVAAEEAHRVVLDHIQAQTGAPAVWDSLDNPPRSPKS